MLAPIVFRKYLHIGTISKGSTEPSNQTYWYIPVEVRANNWWKLLVADIEVRAVIGYIDEDGFEQTPFVTWAETSKPVPFVTLRVGGIEREIIVAATCGKQLLPLDGRMGKIFNGDQALILELSSGNTSLGQWCFLKALVKGVMQEVSPIRMKGTF